MNNSGYDNHAFDKLVDEFLLERWRFKPTEATFEGIHDYDCELDQVDQRSLLQFIQREEKYLARLEGFKNSGTLTQDKMLDLKILEGQLKKDIISERLFSRYRRDPSIYVNLAVFSCMALLLREFAPEEIRYKALISRLKQVPRLLQQGMENLGDADSIPAVWNKIGQASAQSAQSFFSNIILNIAVQADGLKNDMLAAATLASKAFKHYSEFLTNELSQKPEGDFAAGREYFEFLLREFHLLPYNPEDIEKIGLKFIETTIGEIKNLAGRISPEADWTEVIEIIKNDTPSKEALLDYYRAEIIKSRKFVLENDLVSIPDGESLKVIETPASHRNTYPYAAYLSPPLSKRPMREYSG
ncbi:MAG: hypothetical protein CVT49_08300 [candidate division Zixibacteria bacterium HGW-Zixibacteria-1]|nr:MAG: hypothetical protein CVT49_08300 [candidate division Zixibacteria bacterium HGW-Zixibacteria-1]